MQRDLSFSTPFLKSRLIEGPESVRLDSPTVLVNCADRPVTVENTVIRPWRSTVFRNTVVSNYERLVLISLDSPLIEDEILRFREDLKKRWRHVQDIFPLPHLADTQLWRSDKDKIGTTELNLWFAAAGTHCGIHNKHDFMEVHTQVYGVGRMQKFRGDDFGTLYEEVFLAPGMTHEPFCDHDNRYPWHQYYADTDCVWLAIEFHGSSLIRQR
ncbi:MAG: hypothetical protein WD894_07125 [Pirellulales bacterium]